MKTEYLLDREHFQLKQIVAVNTGAHCYTRIPLDQHLAILGDNNRGKTSLLNAMMFFLLPEESLNDFEKKFGFKSKAGPYSKVDTYEYYFPSPSSFLILEAENRHGPFCIVLNQGQSGKPFSYERTCVALPYNEIEHLFWDTSSASNGGLGAPVEGMSIGSVSPALKRLGAVVLKDVASIKEALFTHEPLLADKGRFCILPLKPDSADLKTMDTWRKLIRVAFDIGASDKRTLPNAVATIIEARHESANARIKANFGEVLETHASLKADSDRLNKIKNAQGQWERFDNAFQSFNRSFKSFAQDLLSARHALEQESASIQEQRKTAIDIHAMASSKLQDIKRDVNTKTRLNYELAGEIKGLNKAFEQVKKDSLKLGSLISGYPQHDHLQIAEILMEVRVANDAILGGLRDETSQVENYQNAHNAVIRDDKRKKDIEAALASSDITLLEQVHKASVNVLYTLNGAAFNGLAVSLEADQKQAIKAFTDLFDEEGGSLRFLGVSTKVPFVEFDPATARQALETELDDVKRRLRGNRSVMEQLASIAKKTKEQVEQGIQKLTSENAEIDQDLGLLKRSAYVEQQYQEMKADIEAKQAQMEEQSLELQKLNDAQLTAAIEETNRSRDRSRLEERAKNLNLWISAIDEASTIHLQYLDISSLGLEPEPMVVVDATIASIKAKQHSLSREYNDMRDLLSNLRQQELLPASEHSLYSTPNHQQIADLHGDFSVLFGRLEVEVDSHRNMIETHNHNTSILINHIAGAKALINNFISQMEEHLSEVKVSNLQAIKVVCKLHPQFLELLESLENINLTGGKLHDEVLYERLASFCADFFGVTEGRRTAILKMEHIIEAIEYQVKLEGSDEFTEVTQSNGTTMMISMKVLSFLLKHLLIDATRISIPLIIDELSNVDDRNMEAARKIAEEDGFYILSATPTLSLAITSVIKNFINLNYFSATESYSPKRRVLYCGSNERITDLQPPEPAEAPALTEVADEC